MVQNSDRRDFTGITETTQLMSASSRLGLKTEQDEIVETRDIDNSEDGNFPATKINVERRVHVYHTYQVFHLKILLVKQLI